MLDLFGAFWNLFLLAIPFSLSIFLLKKFQKRWRDLSGVERMLFLLLIGIFILFFPNIPYIFTDIRHVLDRCSPADYYKRCTEAPWLPPLLFAYSAFAIPFFVLAVENITQVWARVFHPLWKRVLPPLLIPLSALGVLIGLFERFNSWDILQNPLGVLSGLFGYVSTPEKFATWIVFSAVFLGTFYFFRAFFFAKKTGVLPHEEL